MFVRKEEQEQMEVLLRDWREQRGNLVPVFVRLHEILGKDGETVFSFKARPGVSYSLRAAYRSASDTSDIGSLFALVDIIDDDPSARWLSVCFYAESVTDPEERGNLIPGGLLGEDGYCFDIFEEDEGLMAYLEARAEEAREKSHHSGSPGFP